MLLTDHTRIFYYICKTGTILAPQIIGGRHEKENRNAAFFMPSVRIRDKKAPIYTTGRARCDQLTGCRTRSFCYKARLMKLNSSLHP